MGAFTKAINEIVGLGILSKRAMVAGKGAGTYLGGAWGYKAGLRAGDYNLQALGAAAQARGARSFRAGMRGMGRWATGAGHSGFKRAGIVGVRAGMMGVGGLAGGYAAVDFMNPWGLGWGD